MPVLELDSGKNTTASYVYGANGVIYRRKHLPGGDEYEYHHVNALGNLAIITDDNESVVARYEYDAFGAVRHQWGNSDNTRKFTGKEYDADVKLYYYGARYYDPYIGRFISRDPAADGLNWYVYCRSNPLAFVDPAGLEIRDVIDLEREALTFAFGEDVDSYLAGIIRVNISPGTHSNVNPDAPNIINLDTKYMTDFTAMDESDYLVTFIHEATHVWQHETGLHRESAMTANGRDYLHTRQQLKSLKLNREEHAQAVAEWFSINWKFKTGELTSVDSMGNAAYRFYYNCQNDEPQSPECLLLPDGFFELFNLDIHYKEEGLCREFEGVLVETPLTGPSGYLVLRDKEGREFRFEDQGDVEDWEKMLDGIQIGKNYSFVISIISLGAPNNLHGMRICGGERLQFFAATYIEGDSYPFTGCFGDQSSRGVVTLDPLAGTDLEGFTYEQLFESLCRSREVEFVSGSVSLFRNIPMLF